MQLTRYSNKYHKSRHVIRPLVKQKRSSILRESVPEFLFLMPEVQVRPHSHLPPFSSSNTRMETTAFYKHKGNVNMQNISTVRNNTI